MIKIGVTGRPGIGKTTLCEKVCSWLKSEGYKVSGFVTREIRKSGRRVGFELVDLETGERTTLASLGRGRVRVGRYSVHIEDLEEYLKGMMHRESGDVVVVDEVGPMELKSRVFVEFVEKVISEDKPALLTLHEKSNHPLLKALRNALKVYRIDEKNRDSVADEVFREIVGKLKK